MDITLRAATSAEVGVRYSGIAVNTVTFAFDHLANLKPAFTAFSAVGVPSVGIRMCLYMTTSLRLL